MEPELPATAAHFRIAIDWIIANALLPHPRNVRRHNRRQLVKLKATIKEYGFLVPVLIDEANTILAGHARVEVAKQEGWMVPCVRVEGLDDGQKRALMLAENKVHDLSDFDPEGLALELKELSDLGINLEVAFETAEIDLSIENLSGQSSALTDRIDAVPPIDPAIVSTAQLGDVWLLGRHRLLCGSALESKAFEMALDSHKADLVFTDPPYNVAIAGHVSGLGRHSHREFAMASGEMSDAEFDAFLSSFIAHCIRFSVDGSIHYICMDWRHIEQLLAAGRRGYTALKSLCVWNKSNGGMGSLYRSKHELIAVFKNGQAPHVNNVELGRHGRYRCNVWDYPGANSFHSGRDDDLAAHPTVKPVALVADAIRDCSRRNALILDPFGGSGTTILAAERTGRRAALIELDPLYVDVTIRRWQALTGQLAVLEGTGRDFAEVTAERSSMEGLTNG